MHKAKNYNSLHFSKMQPTTTTTSMTTTKTSSMTTTTTTTLIGQTIEEIKLLLKSLSSLILLFSPSRKSFSLTLAQSGRKHFFKLHTCLVLDSVALLNSTQKYFDLMCIVLCCVKLCCVMFCFVLLCFVVCCCIVFCFVVLCCVVLCCIARVAQLI